MINYGKEILTNIEAAFITGFLVMGNLSERDLLSGIENKKDREIIKEAIGELFNTFYAAFKRKHLPGPAKNLSSFDLIGVSLPHGR
ncbi:MAG: hypothetical protein GY730_11390 [bacterium]|nr:hypothetical protein [bacterium]